MPGGVQSGALGAAAPGVAFGLGRPIGRPGAISQLTRAIGAEIEAEQARWFLWIAVAFGTGAAFYFGALLEPPAWMLAVVAASTALLHLFMRRSGLWGLASGFMLAIALGAAVAKLRTEYMRAPVLARPITAVQVTGWVELVEPRPTKGQRITIQVTDFERLPQARWPHRVRVRSLTETPGLVPGQVVRVRANLAAPQPPSVAGDFDFGRYAWFYAMGAVGLATGPVVVVESTLPQPLTLRLKAGMESIRYWITRRIMTGLPGETGAIAAALITGERGGITDGTNNAYRDSGLFHILSISGLHMVVMAGAIFVLIRTLLAAVPHVALNYPIKKWAAAGALVGALGYLLMSGSSFATVRSYIMISIMFLAVMLDRQAVSLRNVALSALAILIVFPESIFDPGFQMSYASVAGLISVYEGIRLARENAAKLPGDAGPIRRTAAHIGGSFTTTIIASAAVAPFGVYHFHNTQLLAMLANLVALPLCDLYVMPLALATLIALPLGLEHWPLVAMGWGIDAMTLIAQGVAALPASSVRIPAIPAISFHLMIAGGLWLLLWSRPWRLLGLLPIAAGLVLAPTLKRADMLVSRDGTTIAVRGADGRLTAVAARGGLFELARWLEYDGDKRTAKDVAAAQGFTCDALGCAARVGTREIAYLTSAAGLRDHCATATVIVTRFLPGRGCAGSARTDGPVIIDPARFRSGDGHLIYFAADGVEIHTVGAARGTRPWTPAGQRADLLSAAPDRPVRETNVPFATGPTDVAPDGDDDGPTRRGLVP